jgi:hypothetical protein
MRMRSLACSTAAVLLVLAALPARTQNSHAAGAAGAAAAGAAASGAAGAMSGSLHGPPPWAGGNGGRHEAVGLDSRGAPPGLTRAAEERQSHATELMRLHPDVLDRDPVGNLVVRNELIGVGVTSLARASLQGAGFGIEREEPLGHGNAALLVLSAPPGYSTSRALRLLRQVDPDAAYDFNHIYFESGTTGAVDARNSTAYLPPHRQPTAHDSESLRRIGLIDGGVASGHATLQSAKIVAHGCGGKTVPSAHGTASASRLLDGLHADGAVTAGAEVYVADVYCGAPDGGSAAAIADAIAWLMEQDVPVINVSLAGPPNLVLQRALDLAASRGHLVVAAVGNDGPAAPPLYPAAYPMVVAVTAVDSNDKVLPEAGRGNFVAFAAPGADVEAASLPAGLAKVRGTSFAAPIVAGRLALLLDRPDPAGARQAVRDLAASAVDLGAPGRDPVYGNGCIGCGPLEARAGNPRQP